MRFLKITLLTILSTFMPYSLALAGEAATIVLSSGAVISFNNGYTQLSSALKEFNKVNRRGGDSYLAEINIEGSTFFINLSQVALVCRDTCSSMSIKVPKKE